MKRVDPTVSLPAVSRAGGGASALYGAGRGRTAAGLPAVDQCGREDGGAKTVASQPGVGYPIRARTAKKEILDDMAIPGPKWKSWPKGNILAQKEGEDPVGHAPEMNQFYVSVSEQDEDSVQSVAELLTEGVAHLALARYRGNKLQESSAVRKWDYAIHPVFSAFFGFSHRRKRKMQVGDIELLRLTGDHSASTLIESRIIYRQPKQREDCFQKAVIKRGLRRMRRSA